MTYTPAPRLLYGMCKVPSCLVRVPADHLLCRTHWEMVPGDARRRVYAAWRRLCRLKSAEAIREYRAAVAAVLDGVEAHRACFEGENAP